ncbi:MAG: hypothetical protein U0414_08230 [Polyangiaceae bacterium]
MNVMFSRGRAFPLDRTTVAGVERAPGARKRLRALDSTPAPSGRRGPHFPFALARDEEFAPIRLHRPLVSGGSTSAADTLTTSAGGAAAESSAFGALTTSAGGAAAESSAFGALAISGVSRSLFSVTLEIEARPQP